MHRHGCQFIALANHSRKFLTCASAEYIILRTRTRISLVGSRAQFSTRVSLRLFQDQSTVAITDSHSSTTTAAIAVKAAGLTYRPALASKSKFVIKPLATVRTPHQQTEHPWTSQEDDLLFDLRQQGKTWRAVSTQLQRPIGSCYSRYYRFLDPFLADAIEEDDMDEGREPDYQEFMKSAIEASQRNLEANVPPARLRRAKKEKSSEAPLPLPYSVQGPWTTKDRERLEMLVVAKTPWSVIARDLERNQESCKEKWLRIQKTRLEERRISRRIRGDRWMQLYKEGFTPYHRDQLVQAVEKQLNAKRINIEVGRGGGGRFDDYYPLSSLHDQQNNGEPFAIATPNQIAHSGDFNTGTCNGQVITGGGGGMIIINWEAVASSLHNKFPADRLQSIYHELAAAKLIWTPEEDERLMRAVIRLGPPEFQPKIWTMIKDAFGDVVRTSEDYKARWRILDQPPLEREWDDSEKVKFWRRWMELQRGEESLLATAPFSNTSRNPSLLSQAEAIETKTGEQSEGAVVGTPWKDWAILKESMWDIIAEGLEYRHGRDCELYFKQTTLRFPKDPELFRYLTHEVAKVYLEPRKVHWTPETSRLLVATVNTYRQANKTINWRSVAQILGDRFTMKQCEYRWDYWSQKQKQVIDQQNSATLDSNGTEGATETAMLSAKQDGIDIQPNESHNTLAVIEDIERAKPRLWTDRELELLNQGVQEYGHSWAQIRNTLLPHRTTKALYERYWRSQAKKHGRFTERERSLLETAIQTLGEDADWALIASQVPGRTASQCRKNWKYSRTHHVAKLGEPWTDQDVARLKEAVHRFGTKKWTLVSEYVVGKTVSQCRYYWRDKLDPSVNRKPWSGMELDKLMERVEKIMARKDEEERLRNQEYQTREMEKTDGSLGSKDVKQINKKKANELVHLDLTPRFKGKRKIDWKEVAEGMDGRTPEQCRARFKANRELYRIQEEDY
ncbi:Myb-like DNA-binding domain protein [Lobosporangium transversale]|uniref:Homeodomain-like protein n=1 Tax=Lobosporangium transversale TaxID=64571 RepID=A0A1Y2GSW5_9FUNG|nr:hypothetical protein BCR41DRAFT_350206 [Lobosporangium transversale]KAF9919238.1 Myb-like DNA-binding domain protein [Lobosporangium transversale]ORZ21903.1 hypothetical protein BCR41DRAFT_350206 [Lobosporangium transversale]|eukprot:XP_021883154.1 hypothetical protein BCR41DRAFT_350206 [Lobosporangium transversale]